MITIIVGLPASGKTFYIKSKAGENARIIDDMFMLDSSAFRHYVKHYRDIGYDIFIAAPELCDEYMRDKAVRAIWKCGYDEEIKWIYFENNADKAIKNLNYRQRNGDKRVVSKLWIKDLSKRYTIPAGIEPITIWSEDDET